MTDATELAELLDHWEGRLRELGAPCVEHLRPGLSRREVDNLCDAAGVHLPDDAAFMWMWHDGDRERYEDDWRRPSLVPWKSFLSLGSALERSAQLRRITDSSRPLEERPEDELYFRVSFVILDEAEDPVYLDCSQPEGPTPTGIFLTHDTYRTPRVSLADRIRYRIDALTRGLWRLDPDGEWVVDETRAPDISRWWDLYA